ncbi:MAG: hypothetical protein DSY47_00695 [Hydrogenothermus sp.]|nr:MAG: hypothetical protein DSY47_00695 [Hydrogenothermus sp.]
MVKNKIVGLFLFLISFSLVSCGYKETKTAIYKKESNNNKIYTSQKTENKPLVPKKKYYLPPPPSPLEVIDKTESKSFLDTKRISLTLRNATLGNVLLALAQDLGLNIVITEDVDKSMPISVNFENTPAKEVLEVISSLGNVNYEIKGNIIVFRSIITKTFKIPYIKSLTNYQVSLGGDVLGGGSLSGFGGATGTTIGTGITGGTGIGSFIGGSNLQGNFTLNFSSNQQDRDFFSILEQNIKKLLSPLGKIVIDKQTGTVIITDKVYNIKQVEEYLDVVEKSLSKQVLIEAKIIEVDLNDEWKYGIDWNAIFNIFGSTIDVSQTLALGESTGRIVVSGSNFNSLLEVLAQVGNIETLSNPRIRVINGQPALISTGTVIPFWEKQVQAFTGTTGTNFANNYVRTSVLDGILLGVLPFINDDKTITLNIVPVATNIRGTKQLIQGGNVEAEAPIVEMKEAGTIIKVKDGDTVIIGGLMTKYKEINTKKVPLLAEIPILGNLFKSKQNIMRKKELIIFIKPKIINW